MWQITVFWRLSTTNSNTLIPWAENSHEVKTDLHLQRPEFLRLPAGFANLFSWRKLEGSLIISWKFQGRTPQGIWITAIFPAWSRLVSYDVLHHSMGIRWPFGFNADRYNHKRSCDSQTHLCLMLARSCLQRRLFASTMYEIRHGWLFYGKQSMQNQHNKLFLILLPRWLLQRCCVKA